MSRRDNNMLQSVWMRDTKSSLGNLELTQECFNYAGFVEAAKIWEFNLTHMPNTKRHLHKNRLLI